MKQPTPPCPVCGSSATLPFESEEESAGSQSVAEVMLSVFMIFLSLFLVFLLFLLSHAGLPVALVLALAAFLFWRRKKENQRQGKKRPQTFVCLDCSRNFRA